MQRRDFLGRCALSSLALGIMPGTLFAQETIALAMAGYPYDHVRALMTGDVTIAGCDVDFSVDKIGNLNTHIFEGPQTRGVSEVGLSPFMLATAIDQFDDYALLPVFPLRTFRHKSIFVNADAGIEHPSDLKGKRVGTPGYSSTSLTWIRGVLQDEYGVTPRDVEWVVSAVDSGKALSGQVSKNENVLPEGLSVSTGPAGKDESQMLVDGDVDALFHALEPQAFVVGDPRVKRLFADPRATEQDYFRRTGIFPIMHAVAIRRDLAEASPWVPRAVFDGYVAARNQAYAQLRKQWYFRTLPWAAQELEATRDLMGDNFFPYGIEANRTALETLFRYSHEQGLASRRLSIEELFLPESLTFADG